MNKHQTPDEEWVLLKTLGMTLVLCIAVFFLIVIVGQFMGGG